MGYSTTYNGEITITPPLTWAEIKDSPCLPANAQMTWPDVKFRVVEETTETPGGELTRRYATAIVPADWGAYKGYDIVETVQKIIDQYRDGHEFSGRFDCEGEEAGDLWRLVVRNGRAARVEPRLVWPDDEAGV